MNEVEYELLKDGSYELYNSLSIDNLNERLEQLIKLRDKFKANIKSAPSLYALACLYVETLQLALNLWQKLTSDQVKEIAKHIRTFEEAVPHDMLAQFNYHGVTFGLATYIFSASHPLWNEDLEMHLGLTEDLMLLITNLSDNTGPNMSEYKVNCARRIQSINDEIAAFLPNILVYLADNSYETGFLPLRDLQKQIKAQPDLCSYTALIHYTSLILITKVILMPEGQPKFKNHLLSAAVSVEYLSDHFDQARRDQTALPEILANLAQTLFNIPKQSTMAQDQLQAIKTLEQLQMPSTKLSSALWPRRLKFGNSTALLKMINLIGQLEDFLDDASLDYALARKLELEKEFSEFLDPRQLAEYYESVLSHSSDTIIVQKKNPQHNAKIRGHHKKLRDHLEFLLRDNISDSKGIDVEEIARRYPRP